MVIVLEEALSWVEFGCFRAAVVEVTKGTRWLTSFDLTFVAIELTPGCKGVWSWDKLGDSTWSGTVVDCAGVSWLSWPRVVWGCWEQEEIPSTEFWKSVGDWNCVWCFPSETFPSFVRVSELSELSRK